MIGRIDTQDRMMGRFQHTVNKWFNYKLMGQVIQNQTFLKKASYITNFFRQ